MAQAGSNTFWLDQTFNETLNLLEEAKHYHAYRFSRQVHHLHPCQRLELTRESLRITSRLSHMVSWLLHEKAILNDEITRGEYIEITTALEEEQVCTSICADPLTECPKRLQSLMDRSFSLFMRASRLEKMLRE
jgi:regulator of CtrA degradation